MIEQLLKQLSDIRYQIDLLNLDKQKTVDLVLTDEQKQQIRDIEFEFSEKLDAAKLNAESVEAEVKRLVIENGTSVKAAGLNAVFVAGRVTWDAKALDGYALNHPELFAFRKENEPSAQIRTVK